MFKIIVLVLFCSLIIFSTVLFICFAFNIEVLCVQGLHLWRNSSSEINNELYKGYRKGNPERKINEIVAGLFIINIELNGIAFIVLLLHRGQY